MFDLSLTRFVRRPLRALITCLLVLPALAPAQSQPYPNKPIRLILPFAAGGGADNNARTMTELLSQRLGQPIIIDYKPGAGGTLGANIVAHAPPDGYTLLYATPGQQMTTPHLMDKMPYDPLKSFSSVSQVIQGSNVLVVNKNLPVNSVAELIALAKAKPGTINFASAGIGSSSHLAGELFKSMAGIDIVHVPYKGSGAAITELLGGSIQMAIDTVSVYLPHIKANNLKALAISTLEHNPALPDLPLIADTLPGFDAAPVNYVTAPAGTPRAIIERLNRDINIVLAMPAVREQYEKNGATAKGSTPEAMDALIISESAKSQATKN
jgi:tripartite-type tricarboxylate transporter receptor subunit TctC